MDGYGARRSWIASYLQLSLTVMTAVAIGSSTICGTSEDNSKGTFHAHCSDLQCIMNRTYVAGLKKPEFILWLAGV